MIVVVGISGLIVALACLICDCLWEDDTWGVGYVAGWLTWGVCMVAGASA